jgi:hypothetical protein
MPRMITTALIGLALMCSAVTSSLASGRQSGSFAMAHSSLRTMVPRPVGAKSTSTAMPTPGRPVPSQKIKTPLQCMQACRRLSGTSGPFCAASCYW